MLLVAFAVAAMIWWRVTDADWIDAWMPNIVIGLLAVAATVTIIEGIIQRERVGDRPRVALDELGSVVRNFAAAVVIDYGETHADSFRTPPSDPIGVCDHWLNGADGSDRPRAIMKDGVLYLRSVSSGLAPAFASILGRNRDALPPKITVQVEKSSGRIEHVLVLDDDEAALREIVRQVKVLGPLVSDHGGSLEPSLAFEVAGAEAFSRRHRSN
jgi:hypothetical protein